MKQGMITKSISNLFSVQYEGQNFECNASSKLKQNKQKLIIGDIVNFEVRENNMGYIISCESRFNEFVRPKVANVKFALLVFSYKQPNMNWNLLDKFLISCENNSVEPIIVISKRDLCSPQELEFLDKQMNYYQKWYKVLHNDDLKIKENIKNIVENNLTFLMGQSGVGKSTLLNYIDKNLHIHTNDISLKLNRGKHTTRHTQLYKTSQMNIIDTPGFGMLSIDNLTPENVKSCFVDFFEFSQKCKFGAKCNHISEIKCNVKANVLNEIIPQNRYNSYMEMYQNSLEHKWKK